MLTPLNLITLLLNTLTLPTQAPTPPGTSLILVGAILLVLIILGGVFWVASRRK